MRRGKRQFLPFFFASNRASTDRISTWDATFVFNLCLLCMFLLISGKGVAQQNGEINSSEQVSPSDEEIATIGNLQNDPLVQKIEQVLSEVLSAESQYKPGKYFKLYV